MTRDEKLRAWVAFVAAATPRRQSIDSPVTHIGDLRPQWVADWADAMLIETEKRFALPERPPPVVPRDPKEVP